MRNILTGQTCFEILSSRSNNPPTLPPLTQGLQPLPVRVLPSPRALLNAALLFLYHFGDSKPKGSVTHKEHFWVRRDEIAAFHFLSRKQSFIQAAHSLPSSLVQEKNKQTNTKMCFPGKCSKITQPLASRTGCRAPRPDCSRGKASSGHESEPVQTGR